MEKLDADILIIGAGIAGLSAAEELIKKGYQVLILEARDRIGGRIYPVEEDERDFELGAEFVHEIHSPLSLRCQEASISLLNEESAHYTSTLSGIHPEEGKWEELARGLSRLASYAEEGSTVSEVLPKEETLDVVAATGFIQGYEAADLELLDSMELEGIRKTAIEGASEALRPEGGYGRVLETYRKGLDRFILLGRQVKRIAWEDKKVTVLASCLGTEVNFRASQVLVTLSAGVLKANPDLFEPKIPKMQEALSSIHMGSVVRIVFFFTEPVWPVSDTSFALFLEPDRVSPECPFTVFWVSGLKLTAWSGGGLTRELRDQSREQKIDAALECLAKALGKSKDEIAVFVQAAFTHDWQKDPYALGAYAYFGVGGRKASSFFREPIRSTLFFAGEAWAEGSAGTVNAALNSGIATANQIHQVRTGESGWTP